MCDFMRRFKQHFHKFYLASLLQIAPFWLLSEGVIRTLSSLAIASKEEKMRSINLMLTNDHLIIITTLGYSVISGTLIFI